MEPADNFGWGDTKGLYTFISDIKREIINRNYFKSENYEGLQPVIIELVQRIRRVYYRQELETMEIDPNFTSQIRSFLNHRIALGEHLASSANRQDTICTMTTFYRLIGFTAVAINSLHADGILLAPFLAISPILKFLGRNLAVICFYLGTGCLIASLYGYYYLKHANICAINAIEEDKELSESVDNLLSEKDTVVEELFTIDDEVITGIEGISYLTDTEKTFAVLLISSMQKKGSLCIYDKEFLFQAYMFSSSETAKIWYRRALYRIRHVDQPISIGIQKEDIFQLKWSFSTTNQSEELLIFLLKALKVPGFVVFGLCSVFFYYEIRKFKIGSKYVVSNNLRQLALRYKKVNETLT